MLDHCLTSDTAYNQKSWVDFLRNDMFGSEFNATCKDVWNRGMNTLMNAPKEDGDTRSGYNWRNHTQTTRYDILELLRGSKMVDLAKKRKFSGGDGMCVQVGAWIDIAGGVLQIGKGGSKSMDQCNEVQVCDEK